MISFIIPFYTRWSLTHARMMEFYNHLRKYDDIEYVLVDDCSPEDNLNAMLFWQRDMKMKVIPHRNRENLGFGGSMNEGAKLASGDILVFYSNDVLCSGDFIPILKEKITDDILLGEEIIFWAAGWNEFIVDDKPIIVPYVNGWFISCTRSTWDKLDGFDPIYGKFDYEDVDLSTQALVRGMDLKSMKSKMLHHLGSATISLLYKNRQARTEENRKKYIEKWSEALKKWSEGS